MKFSFKSDMKKGDCSSCPLLTFDKVKEEWFCLLSCEPTSLEVDPADCPLEEYHGIEWHPYPQEKPPHRDFYLVSYRGLYGKGVTHSCLFSTDGEFVANDRNIYAWAEMPAPYKEEE